MPDSPTPVTKQDVAVALAGLKVGRSRARGYRYVMSIMHRYGNAHHIDELDPKFYPAVFAAAGGDVITAEKFYGAVVDLPPTIVIPTPEAFYGVVLDVPKLKSTMRQKLRLRTPLRAEVQARLAAAPRSSTRILSPLVADLERKLAERTGRPRSRPNYVVNVGNPMMHGDDAPPRQYPSDGRKMS